MKIVVLFPLVVLSVGTGLLLGLFVFPVDRSPSREEAEVFQEISSNLIAAKDAAIAAQKAASNPVIVYQEAVKEVRISPNLEYRCVVAPTSVTVEGGINIWIGETVICGYNLATVGVLGPTIKAHTTAEGILVPLEAIGLEVDVLCATLKAGMD